MSLESLIANVKSDLIQIDQCVIKKAREFDGKALYTIAEGYHVTLNYRQDVSNFEIKAPRMIAWYLLSADKKHAESYFRLAYYHTIADNGTDKYINAMKWYLMAVKESNKFTSMALDGIASFFENGHGVSPDKRRSLEWYYKYDSTGDKVSELNKEGYHLTEKEKKKSLDELLEEAQYIWELEMYKTQPLEIFLAHQKEVKKMKNKIKTLEQQLKSMNDKIIALEIRSPRPQRNRPSPTDKSDTKKNKNKSKPK